MTAMAIPGSALKVVENLKEVVKNSDDEIYAMLKDCNMDPNETVQRLLLLDTFHEVRRKRDKRKETGSKETSDSNLRSSGVPLSGRGGRVPSHVMGRGNFIPRSSSTELKGSRALSSKDNGVNQNSRSSVQYSSGTRVNFSVNSNTSPSSSFGVNYSSTMPPPQAQNSSNSSLSNTTNAGIVKENTASQQSATLQPYPAGTQRYVPSHREGLSAAQFPATDSSLIPSKKHSDALVQGSIKIANYEEVSVRDPIVSDMEHPSVSSSSKLVEVSNPNTQVSTMDGSDFKVSGEDSTAVGTATPSFNYGGKDVRNWGITGVETTRSSHVVTGGSMRGRNTSAGNQLNGRAMLQQRSNGNQKAGPVFAWKPKQTPQVPLATQQSASTSSTEDVRSSVPASVIQNNVPHSVASSKPPQPRSMTESPVIIPAHLQVSEEERASLSFGSFRADFEGGASSSSGSDSDYNDDKGSLPDEEGLSEVESAVEQEIDQANDSSTRSSTTPIPDQSFTNEAETSNSSVPASSDVTSSIESHSIPQAETLKSEPATQTGPAYPYLSTVSSYQGLGLMPQAASEEYSYETAETQPPEPSRLPNFVPSYSELPGFLNPMLRASLDAEARFSQYANASSKYTGGFSLVTAQSPASLEGGSAVLATPGLMGGQTSQQPVAMQAYPAQPTALPLPASMLGYQFIPPGYTLMPTPPPTPTPTPYQVGFSGNTSYTHLSALGNNYPPAQAAALKYSLAQYKPSLGAINAPHAAVAAGYVNSSGYSATPSASGYDDVLGPQFKETSLYIPSQQVDSPGLWVQTQTAREIAANSYYTITGQGQHVGYAPSQPLHAYASLYHPSQTPPHHLLQHPQATLGGTQAAAYQQTQRGPLIWGSIY